MKIITMILTLLTTVFLSGCVTTYMLPAGPWGTIKKMHETCATTHQHVTKSLEGYYVKNPEESIMVKECTLANKKVYFSQTAWKTLQQSLKKYSPKTEITPMPSISGSTISKNLKSLILKQPDSHWTILDFKRSKWEASSGDGNNLVALV